MPDKWDDVVYPQCKVCAAYCTYTCEEMRLEHTCPGCISPMSIERGLYEEREPDEIAPQPVTRVYERDNEYCPWCNELDTLYEVPEGTTCASCGYTIPKE